jgi:hypothetical protein
MQSFVKILTPASSSALTTLANVKQSLAIADSDTSSDAFLTSLINRASTTLANFCGWPGSFGSMTIQETFHIERFECAPRSHRPIILSYLPTSITSVTENGNSLTQDTDYVLDGSTITRTLSSVLTHWLPCVSIVVTYTAGYDLPDNVPADLEGAALAMIQTAFINQGRDPSIIMEQVENVGRVQYNPAITSTGVMSVDPALSSVLVNYQRFV